MLSIFLIALGLATIGHYPTHAARAVSSLEVSLSTPTDKVASASELRVIATVKNVGDEVLKVLKFGTVLDHELRTPIFIIRKDSKEVRFTRDVMVRACPPHCTLPSSCSDPSCGRLVSIHGSHRFRIS